MTKAVDYNPTQEQQDLMRNAMKVKRINYDPSFDRKNIIWRKRNLKILEEKSKFGTVAERWSTLTSTQKTAWETAGGYCGLGGYALFTQDTDYRIRNGISGVATPSIHHQYKVIKVEIGEDGDYIALYQHHIQDVEYSQKNVGQKNARTWVTLEEPMESPFKIEFDYYADLEYVGGPGKCELEIKFKGLKSGVPTTRTFTYPLSLITNWVRFSETMSPDLDTIEEYFFETDIDWVKGTIMFDNFNFESNGTNWAYNPNCDIEFCDDYRIDWGVNVLSYPSWLIMTDDDPIFADIFYLE